MIDSTPLARSDSPVVTRLHPSPNHGERKPARGGEERNPDSIILHYTGMAEAAKALLWLCNPLSQVSCHYFVFEDGRIFQLVPESRRAWHAGRSAWQGETDMNSASIGIEIANAGHVISNGFDAEGRPLPAADGNPFPPPGPPFPPAQIEAVITLVADIKARWHIRDARILAHSDIAPGRKIDPGETFPWEKLAQSGLGVWPQAPDIPPTAPTFRLGDEGMPVRALQSLFAAFGYGIEISGVYDQRTFDVVSAFQRHWRQARVDGIADGETLAMLRAVAMRARL
jgi:N-acetylmuramoyl-L-alanine amidase